MTIILSDIHGNYPALQAVMREIKEKPCDLILSLGDVCGYYCMVNECIELLRENNVVHILGNHDVYLLEDESCPRSSTVNQCIAYQREILSPDHRQWLASCKRSWQSEEIFAVHGGWNDFLDEYISIETFSIETLRQLGKKIYLSGHTHIQGCIQAGGLTYCNPGSVGQPRDRDRRAAYAILDGEKIELCRVEYDIQAICDAMRQAGFSNRTYENLQYGLRIGEKSPDGEDDKGAREKNIFCDSLL